MQTIQYSLDEFYEAHHKGAPYIQIHSEITMELHLSIPLFFIIYIIGCEGGPYFNDDKGLTLKDNNDLIKTIIDFNSDSGSSSDGSAGTETAEAPPPPEGESE
ncbi:hypothetical protein MATL_G00130310 [Megalops atlanticus]|uniref:Uncharacterized protein n=1 Tax=Megalops atlanticus TaxID=7932 RepID=A0A9D3T3W6_MEGAT|nr:hypothetical protein MATL_G00130310 [Megalops atlanticus]